VSENPELATFETI